jgi:hypothetical protein
MKAFTKTFENEYFLEKWRGKQKCRDTPENENFRETKFRKNLLIFAFLKSAGYPALLT